MAIQVSGAVGPQTLGDGAIAVQRLGRGGDLIASLLHGRYYEQNLRESIFCAGMGATAINNATFTVGTLTASCTPILGVWNPLGSGVNLVILEARLGVIMTALQATGCGPFVWATSLGNAVISTGAAPTNRKTLARSGSRAKDMSGVALTGLTNNLAVCCGSSLGGGSATTAAFLATQVALQTQQAASIEDFGGSLIIPPGGVLALLASSTPVAHSAASCLLWEEVPA